MLQHIHWFNLPSILSAAGSSCRFVIAPTSAEIDSKSNHPGPLIPTVIIQTVVFSISSYAKTCSRKKEAVSDIYQFILMRINSPSYVYILNHEEHSMQRVFRYATWQTGRGNPSLVSYSVSSNAMKHAILSPLFFFLFFFFLLLQIAKNNHVKSTNATLLESLF